MPTRYLAVLSGSPALHAAVRAAVLGASDAKIAVDQSDLLLITSAATRPILLERGEGAVLGSIFARKTGKPMDRFDGGWEHVIPTTAGAGLIRDFWGSYVAFVRRPSSREFSVVRAPFGALPCLTVRVEQALLLASDLEMLAIGGWRPQGIAWDQVTRHLAMRDLPRRQTCLAGVEELRGGERLIAARGGIALDQLWSPWDHAGPESWASDRAAAVAAVRAAVMGSVRSISQGASSPLLLLSGGLDSSIVAMSLAAAESSFSCLNLTSSSAIGDERSYARLVADALGARLIEERWCTEQVDVTRSAAAAMPNPSARNFMQESDRLTREAAARVGADLLLDGGGGDNVFCSLQSAAPVAEAIRSGIGAREVLSVAQDIAELARTSVPNVLLRAVRRAARRTARYRWPRDLRFVSREVRLSLPLDGLHPWLIPRPKAGAGTVGHIALLAAAQGWAERLEPEGMLPRASPLATQPVVEACLGIPSWWWFRDGRNRAIAREAFADCLPPQIARRSSKGSPDGFVAELFERNRPAIRTMLLDGRLRAERLIDAAAIERVLADSRPIGGPEYRRIMRLADVEAWAGGWT